MLAMRERWVGPWVGGWAGLVVGCRLTVSVGWVDAWGSGFCTLVSPTPPPLPPHTPNTHLPCSALLGGFDFMPRPSDDYYTQLPAKVGAHACTHDCARGRQRGR